MPKKVRELIRDLETAGFVSRGVKGSHRNYLHPAGIALTLSGRPGDDALPYQVHLVKRKIEETKG